MITLLIGCGSKFGLRLLQSLLEGGHTVYSITGSQVEPHDRLHQLTVDWATCNQATVENFLRNLPELDLVFFNNNATSLSSRSFNHLSKFDMLKLEKHWVQSYFNSCILPFHIVHNAKLKSKSKVVWMLSSYIYSHEEIEHADYLGNKFQNYLIMRNFSLTNRSCFMGINPDNLANQLNMENVVSLLTDHDPKLNGKVIYFDGSEDKNFNKFTKKVYNTV